MSRAAAILFGLLVAATFAAFFVAQRIKNTPSVVQRLMMSRFFSPNGDGRFDRARITFRLKEGDDVTVTVLNAAGDPVRTLLDDKHIPAYQPLNPALRWDGRDGEGRMVPDGLYRIRITLRGQGRSVAPQRSIRKDTTPPRPVVTSMGPDPHYGPELLPRPDGRAAVAHFQAAPKYRPRAMLFRTSPGRPRLVLEQALKAGDTAWSWDGTRDGRRASPGTYLAVLEWRDQAGNVGTSVPLDKAGLPVLDRGRLRGRGGITVRYLAAQAPAEPVKARDPLQLAVDSRQKRFSWDIRRLGTPQPRKRGGPKTKPIVTTAAPGGTSGVYLFEVRTRDRATRVPFAVQARRSIAGTAARPRGVLVLLPFVTWQGRNPVDDDGDGAPNLLDLDQPARLRRPAAGDGLPAGFAEHEAPMLLWLDRTGRSYDITTDAALLAGRGPQLAGHKGVLIPGDARWLPTRVRQQLRAFARRGGTVVSLGTDSLRRTVQLDDRHRLTEPSEPKATDLFGARLRPLAEHETNLEIFQDDEIQLFAGTGGLIPAVPAWEATERVGSEADQVANAVTVDPPGRTVVVAARFGKGLVIRPGFPSFAQRANANDPAVSELMARMWTLLSR
jgi:hypothetical protein